MKLIGLTGAAGSGKDSVGQMILDNKSGYTRAIADPLKRAAVCVFGDGGLFEAARELFALTDDQMRDLNQMAVEVPYWEAPGCELVERLGLCLEREFGSDIWERTAVPLLTYKLLDDCSLEEEIIAEWDGNEWGLSPRQVIKRFGDAIRSEFGTDVLLKRAELDLITLCVLDVEQGNSSDVVVYTDIRTDLEAEWIRDRGGVVIQVFRPAVAKVSAHSTEQGVSPNLLSDWIHNGSDLGELRYHVGYNLQSWLVGAVDIDHAKCQRSVGTVRPLCRDGWVTRVARQLYLDVDGMSDKQAVEFAKTGVADMYDGHYHTPEAAAEILGNRWAEKLDEVA